MHAFEFLTFRLFPGASMSGDSGQRAHWMILYAVLLAWGLHPCAMLYAQDAPPKRKDPRAEFEAKRAAKAKEAGQDVPSDSPSSRSQEEEKTPGKPAVISTSGFCVGDKIRWRLGQETFSGTVLAVPDADTLKVQRDSDGKRGTIYASWAGFAAYPVGQRFEIKKSGGSMNTAILFGIGRNVQTKEYSSLSRENLSVLPAKTPRAPGLAKLDVEFASQLNPDLRDLLDLSGVRPHAPFVPVTPGIVKLKNSPDGMLSRGAEQIFASPINNIIHIGIRAVDASPAALVRYDSAKQTDDPPIEFSGQKCVIDVSIDGARAITEADGLLTVWRLEPGKPPVKTLTFEPFGAGSRFVPGKHRAWLIDGDRVLTVGDSGSPMVGWKVAQDSAVAVWYSSDSFYNAAAISSQRNLIYLGSSRGLLVDPRNGKVTRSASLPKDLGFNADGQWVAHFLEMADDYDGIKLMNFADASRSRDCYLPLDSSRGGVSAVWVDSQHLLLDSGYLYSINEGFVPWRFTDIPATTVFQGNGLAWALGSAGDGRVSLHVAAPISSKVVAATLNALPDEVFCCHKGQTVSINIDLRGMLPGTQEALIRSVKNRFIKEGLTPVTTGGDVELTLSSTLSPPKTVEAIDYRSGEKLGMVTFIPAKWHMKLRKGGNLVWQHLFERSDIALFRQDNESAQECFEIEQKRLCQELPNHWPLKIPMNVQMRLDKSDRLPTGPLFPGLSERNENASRAPRPLAN